MWNDMTPEATDIVFVGKVYDSIGDTSLFTIDRVQDGDNVYFRATIGNLFGSQEMTRGKDLEMVLRQFYYRMEHGRFAA